MSWRNDAGRRELIDRTGFHRWDHIKFARRLSELTLAKKKKKLDISFSDTGIKKIWMKEETDQKCQEKKAF